MSVIYSAGLGYLAIFHNTRAVLSSSPNSGRRHNRQVAGVHGLREEIVRTHDLWVVWTPFERNNREAGVPLENGPHLRRRALRGGRSLDNSLEERYAGPARHRGVRSVMQRPPVPPPRHGGCLA